MAAYEKEKGKTLFQKMIDLYVQYGFYKEHLISITKKGMDGQQQIAAMMESYRNNPPQQINGVAVEQLLDYEMRKGKNLLTGSEWEIKLPKSNVLQFILTDGSKISARPSGTEPKIKFYFSVNAKLGSTVEFEKTGKELDDKIKAIIADMKL
jgi:phosphoglucomutase